MRKTEPRKNRKLYRQIVSLWLGLWLVTPAGAFALPGEGQIAAGTGSISSTGPDMTIQQDTSKMTINWQSFNVGATETVTFNQPDINSVALNRVIGVDPSIILGKISANGQVFLSNPSGVVFGQGSRVDVHGLLATTLSITDQNFEGGNYQFSQDANKSLASVINNGIINAERYVGLIASAVQNNGTLDNNGSYVEGRIIVADLGYVALGSGTVATLDFNGDGLISFAVDGEVSGSVTDTQGNVIGDRINNTGLIRANGGQVLLTAQSARNFIGNVINHTGIIEAQTVFHEDGKIILSSADRADSFSASEVDVQAEVIEAPPVEYKEWPHVLVEKRGVITLFGGRQGDVNVSGTLDASQVLVTAGSANNGSGTVTVSAGEMLTTNNGNIAIVADDLVLEGDLDAGTGDVFFIPANGGNLTLSQDGSMGADIGGNDLSHITARNLGLGTTGNILVKGMNEESTQGISGSVFLVSGGNIIFNTGDSVFSALNVFADNNINVNQNVTTTRGDFVAKADFDNDGKGNFNVAPGVTITSSRDIDISAPLINSEDSSYNETRDLILNGNVVGGEPTPPPVPPLTSVEAESISQGSLGSFLTEFFENGGSSDGC